MTRGRTPDPGRAKRDTGHRPKPGEAKPLAVVMSVEESLAAREAPADLTPVGADAWSKSIREMAANKHLHESDLVLLRMYCDAVSTEAEATACIAELGAWMKDPILARDPASDDPDEQVVVGYRVKPNPMTRIQKDASASARQMADVLGLSPIARIRAGLMEVAAGSIILDMNVRLRQALAASRQ